MGRGPEDPINSDKLAPAERVTHSITQYVGLLSQGHKEEARDLKEGLIRGIDSNDSRAVRKLFDIQEATFELVDQGNLTGQERSQLWHRLKSLIESR